MSISVGSQRLLLEKVAKEFDETYESFDPENKGVLDYSSFNQFLEKMGFTRNDPDHPRYTEERNLLLKAWGLLLPPGVKQLSKQNVIVFLLCVLDLFPPSLASPGPSKSNVSLGSLVENEFTVTQ